MNLQFLKSHNAIGVGGLLVGMALISAFFFWFKTFQSNKLKLEVTQQAETQYQATVYSQQLQAEAFYDRFADEISMQISGYDSQNIMQRNKTRQALLDRFAPTFEQLKNLGVGVLHIFDSQGNSLLRFHEPTQYGDPLKGYRFSVKNITDKQLYTKGQEIGRYREAYRFVFPLFYDGNYVGGIEYSIDFLGLEEQLLNMYGGAYMQLLYKPQVQHQMVTEMQPRFYVPSSLSSEFYSAVEHHFLWAKHGPLIKQVQQQLQLKQRMAEEKSFSEFISYQATSYAVSFTALTNTENHFVGYLLSIREDDSIVDIENSFMLNLAISLFLWAVVISLWHKRRRHQFFVQSLIDQIDSMVVITHGFRLQFANRQVLSFFDSPSIKRFIDDHTCICEYFLEEEGYLTKMMGEQTWIEYMQAHPQQNCKVAMRSPGSGVVHFFSVEMTPFEGENDVYLVSLHDITLLASEQEVLKHETQHDPMTGVFNRKGFDILYHQAMERYAKRQEPFSLIMFDIDYFKKVNDKYGHDIGDVVLKRLSSMIDSNIRSEDYLIRWGGEEFLILLSKTRIEEAEKVAEQLRLKVENLYFEEVEHVTCSFGVAEHTSGTTVEQLIKQCDKALYQAKDEGRNRVVSIVDG